MLLEQSTPMQAYGGRLSGEHAAPTTLFDTLPERKRGREPKWIPLVLSENDRVRASTLMAEYAAGTSADESVWARYARFCQANALERNSAKSLELCVGQMSGHLAPGTVANYVRTICKKITRTPASLRVARAHADADTTHAADRNRDQIEELLQTILAAGDLDTALTAYLLATTGVRSKDGRWLRCCQVTLVTAKRRADTAQYWRLQMRITKTVKRRAQRKTLLFPIWHHQIPTSVAEHLEQLRSTEPRRRIGVPHAALRAAILRADRTSSEHTKPASSYTLRRAFFAAAFEKCNGDVDLVAKRFSLHQDGSMLEAFYIDWENSKNAAIQSREVDKWFN